MASRHYEHTDDTLSPLFNYTSGRWLYNEHLRLAERRLHFNVNALCGVVAKSVGQRNTDIVHFTKIAEGGSYRIFETTFRDGSSVIVRLPYPSTIPRKYGVASEVATIEFLWMHGIPIPKIFDWSSSRSNEIGSEYIIMERAQGKALADTWFTMTFEERMRMIEKIVEIERSLFDILFPASGSLFFKDSLDTGVRSVDIPGHSSLKEANRFCIGPSTEYLWWYQRRNELATNHGPWESSEELLRAVGERESRWLHRSGKARYPREPLYREFYGHRVVQPQVQINWLSDYLKLTPHLVPKSQELNIPTIRHPDLSPSNIFVSDSGNITGVIDWQHATVLPIFLQAKVPKHFQNYGDDDSENFRRPKIAADFAQMTDSEKEVELELYRRRQVHYFYVGYTSSLNKAHFHAMGQHSLVLRNQLYGIASRPCEGDNTSLQAALVRTLAGWPDITSSAERPPVHYASVEVEECLSRDAKQKNADGQMQRVRDFIGIDIEGWVDNTEYENARERARLIKDEMAQGLEIEEERREFDEY